MSILDIANSCGSHIDEGTMLPKSRFRVQQLDADGSCYAIADPSISVDDNTARMINYIDGLRRKADCDEQYVHTTLKLKGGREYVADFKPYQEDRNHGSPDYVKRVRELRHELVLACGSIGVLKGAPQYYVEADDSMIQFQRQVVEATGDQFSSVISTNDKDLNMAMGVVQNINSQKFTTQGIWDAERKQWTDCYGKTEYDADKKKLVGRGTSFFWHQMLAGDPVDAIVGLPAVMPEVANIIMPVKNSAGRKPKSVAYGSVCRYLADCRNDVSAARRVRMMYNAWSSAFGKPWLFEEMGVLLWMQQNPSPYDFYRYLAEDCNMQIQPHAEIAKRINSYFEVIEEVKNAIHV